MQGWRGFHVLLLANKLAKYGLDLQRDYYVFVLSLCVSVSRSLTKEVVSSLLWPTILPLTLYRCEAEGLRWRAACTYCLGEWCAYSLCRASDETHWSVLWLWDGRWGMAGGLTFQTANWSRRMLCDTKQPTTTVVVDSLVLPEIHKRATI